MIEFYTDGSWRQSQNTGGYGVVALRQLDSGETALIYAYQEQKNCVTNNQMELMAIIHACEIADKYFPNEEIIIYSDSSYCVESINKWMRTWVRNGWRNSKKEEVKNIDLMKILYHYFSIDFYHCQIRKAKAHCGDPGNELADSLACQNKTKFLKTIKENHIIVKNFDFYEKL